MNHTRIKCAAGYHDVIYSGNRNLYFGDLLHDYRCPYCGLWIGCVEILEDDHIDIHTSNRIENRIFYEELIREEWRAREEQDKT